MVIDDRAYFVFVSQGRAVPTDGVFAMTFVAHLNGNDRGKLLVHGLTTRDYWLDFPNNGESPEEYYDKYLTLTPRAMVAVIQHAISRGWDPTSAGQITHRLDNEELRLLLEESPTAPR